MRKPTLIHLGAQYDPLVLQAPEKGSPRMLCKDGICEWLYLRLSASGLRRWYFHRDRHSMKIEREIGDASLITLSQARAKAFMFAELLESGVVPPTKKETLVRARQEAITVGQAWVEYYKHITGKSKLRVAKEINRGYEKYWDSIRGIPIKSLTSVQIRNWMNDLIEKHGDSTSDKQIRQLKALVRWAVANLGLVLTTDPLSNIKPPKIHAREQYLKSDEVSCLDAALKLESEDVRHAIYLLEWSEIDWHNCTWHIPPEKTKSRRKYVIALTPRVMDILEERKPLMTESQWVFPTNVPRSATPYLSCINNSWLRKRERAGLGNLRIHDLRHTAASWMAQNGGTAWEIKQALQHATVRTSERYIHLNVDDVRNRLIESQEEMVGTSLAPPKPRLVPVPSLHSDEPGVSLPNEEQHRLKVIKGFVRKTCGQKYVVAGYQRKQGFPKSPLSIAREAK
jgi:integrase